MTYRLNATEGSRDLLNRGVEHSTQVVGLVQSQPLQGLKRDIESLVCMINSQDVDRPAIEP